MRLRVALAYAWHIPPDSLRHATLTEIRAMIELLEEIKGQL